MIKSPSREAKVIAISKANLSNSNSNNQNTLLLIDCANDLKDLEHMINDYLGNCDQF